MIKNKLYSVMDEEGNLGYYLYNESTGEEKTFSVVEEEKMFARGVNIRNLGKGLKKVNKAANREYFINKGRNVFEASRRSPRFKSLTEENRKLSEIIRGGKSINPDIHSLNDIYLIKGKSIGVRNRRSSTPDVIRSIDTKGSYNSSGDTNTKLNKEIMK